MDAIAAGQIGQEPSHTGVHAVYDWRRELQPPPEALADMLGEAPGDQGCGASHMLFQVCNLAGRQDTLQFREVALETKRTASHINKGEGPVDQLFCQLLVLRCNPT